MNLLAAHDFIGQPWSYPDNDCWAVFRKASAAIFGVEIPEIELPDEPDTDANTALFVQHSRGPAWEQIPGPLPGCAVLFRNRVGIFVHIGLYIQNGNVLHCRGSADHPGQTQYDELRVLLRFYGSAEFFRHVPDHDN